jgi:hypothetical protein
MSGTLSANTLQVLLTVGMWFACMKYHPTYGLPGTQIKGDTLPEQLVDLGRGWEWWPSVLWQIIWTWVVSHARLMSTQTQSLTVLCRVGRSVSDLARMGDP